MERGRRGEIVASEQSAGVEGTLMPISLTLHLLCIISSSTSLHCPDSTTTHRHFSHHLIPPPHSIQPNDSSSSPLHSRHGSYLLVRLGGDDAARCGGAQRLWFDAAAGSQGDTALGFLLLVAADLHSEGGGTWGWNKVAA
ncbi:hypothetical protein Droror1_Dr00001352 [Drosera rotundifolia]